MFRCSFLMAVIGLATLKSLSAQPLGSIPGNAFGLQGTIQGTIPSGPVGAGGQGTPVPSVPGLPVPGAGGYRIISPAVQPTLSPGVLELVELEGRFSQAVEEGGGKAFVQWFAEDAVVLNDGKPAVLGRGAIAAQAQWDPKQYKLTWVVQGAQMGPSKDMGFTWGHYEGHAVDPKGQPVVTSGRYITVWKKTRDAGWKVAMDASATEPAGAAECCVLPKP